MLSWKTIWILVPVSGSQALVFQSSISSPPKLSCVHPCYTHNLGHQSNSQQIGLSTCSAHAFQCYERQHQSIFFSRHQHEKVWLQKTFYVLIRWAYKGCIVVTSYNNKHSTVLIRWAYKGCIVVTSYNNKQAFYDSDQVLSNSLVGHTNYLLGVLGVVCGNASDLKMASYMYSGYGFRCLANGVAFQCKIS